MQETTSHNPSIKNNINLYNAILTRWIYKALPGLIMTRPLISVIRMPDEYLSGAAVPSSYDSVAECRYCLAWSIVFTYEPTDFWWVALLFETSCSFHALVCRCPFFTTPLYIINMTFTNMHDSDTLFTEYDTTHRFLLSFWGTLSFCITHVLLIKHQLFSLRYLQMSGQVLS